MDSILFIVACSNNDDVDTTKPTIELIKPIDEANFHPGDKLEFVCNFNDDTKLASYKVEIHNNFNGHDHTSPTQLKAGLEEEEHPWSYQNSWNFDDGISTANIKHHEIQIPLTINQEGVEEEIAEGHYHLGVYCLDAAGNENSVFIEIEIEHEDHIH